MNRGICKLCHNESVLLESHFLPAAIYKSLLNRAERNPHPYLMSATRTIESSRQIQDHILCAECEDRFNRGGESWVLSQMAREKGFPLQEKLLAASPIQSIPGLTTYAAGRIKGIDVDKLEYFALSVFWRASVHTWKPPFGEKYERLELGPYRERLGLYLLGGPFPKDVVTLISVCTASEFDRGMFPPFPGIPRPNEGRPYSFLIPGIQFSMVLGRGMTAESRELSSHISPERRVFISPLVNDRALLSRIRLIRKQWVNNAGRKET